MAIPLEELAKRLKKCSVAELSVALSKAIKDDDLDALTRALPRMDKEVKEQKKKEEEESVPIYTLPVIPARVDELYEEMSASLNSPNRISEEHVAVFFDGRLDSNNLDPDTVKINLNICYHAEHQAGIITLFTAFKTGE